MLKPQDLLRRILFTEKSIKNIQGDIHVLQQEKAKVMLEYDNKIKAKKEKLNRAKQYQLSLLQPEPEQGIDKNIFEPEENTIQYFIDKYGLEVFDGAKIQFLEDFNGCEIDKSQVYELYVKGFMIRTTPDYNEHYDGLYGFNHIKIRLIKKGGKYAKEN